MYHRNNSIMRWYDWPFSLCLACRVYISTIIIITLVSAKSAPGSHRWLQSRGDRWAEPCAFDVPAGWAIVLFTHITCVIIYPGIPSLCFLALGRDPSVRATLVSYQNFLAPKMVQSLSQNWLHFLWSKCKWKAHILIPTLFRTLGLLGDCRHLHVPSGTV